MRTKRWNGNRKKKRSDRDTLLGRYVEQATHKLLKTMFFSGLAWAYFTWCIGYFFFR